MLRRRRFGCPVLWCGGLALQFLFGILSLPASAQEHESPGRAAGPAEAPASPGDSLAFRAFWNHGIRFATADEQFTFKLGGRIMNDWAWFRPQPGLQAAYPGEFADGTEFRRARFYLAGTLYERIDFKFQADVGSGIDLKDVYIGVTGIPVLGNLYVGHLDEPVGLEVVTSSKYITFMERSPCDDTFAPGRNTGVLAYNASDDELFCWSAGVFRDADDQGRGTGGNNYAVTARVTGAPWSEDDGARMLHLGVSASYRNMSTYQYASKPEAHLAPALLDTGVIAADSAFVLGLEIALVYEAFSFQAEYFQTSLSGVAGGDPTFSLSYAQVSVFLTGEHRPYAIDLFGHVFDRIEPKESVFGGGPGAIELAARFSLADFADHGIAGSVLASFTGGVNWYLTSMSRIMLNAVITDQRGVGHAWIIETRFQIEF